MQRVQVPGVPGDGGRTARYSLSGEWRRRTQDALTEAHAYALRSDLALYNDFTYFKVIKVGEEFFRLEKSTRGSNGSFVYDYKMLKIDIDNSIKYFGNNAKCVLRHSFFLNEKMKSVKSNKYHLGEIDKIIESIKK